MNVDEFHQQIKVITSRKQVQEAIEKPATLQEQAVLDLVYDTVIVRGVDSIITFWNHAAEEMYGWTKEEALAKNYYKFLQTECPKPLEEIEAALLSEGRWEGELVHTKRDSTSLVVVSRWVLQRDKNGKPTEIIEINKPITQRRWAESALRESEERYRQLVELSPDTIFVQSEGKFILVNHSGAKLLGAVTPQELVGKSVIDFLHPDYREIVLSRMRQLKETPKEVPLIEEKWLRLDGTVIDVEAAATFFSYGGKPVAQVVLRDITKRKQAETALQQLNANLENQVQERTAQLQQALEFEAMLKRITDKVRDSLDESQILQTAVQELAFMPGVTCCNTALYNQEQGTSTITYEYATSIPAAQARVVQIASLPEVYQQLFSRQYFQFCSIIPNPTRGRVAMLACPIFDDQGVLGDLWLINQQDHAFNDLEIRLVQQVANQCAIAIRQARLTHAARAQVEELEKLNSLKDHFLSTISHELRTPISNMKMAIHMLKVSSAYHERGQRYLEILQTECARENELIDNLLDLQRLEAGSYRILLTESWTVQDWLLRIIEPFRSRIEQRQLTLQLNLPAEPATLVSNRGSLERILAELLINACKYTHAGGEIVLEVESVFQAGVREEELSSPYSLLPNASTIFTISNSAEIPALELPLIFDKFYRLPKADRWKEGGTGLGLTLVQKLVEQLQGTIQVKSSRGWTTFTVKLLNEPVF